MSWERIAAIPSGRRTKWLVVAGWLVVVALATVVAGRIGDVETNDSRNWLPASAESTRALDLAEREFTADEPEYLLLLYVRGTGVTDADREKARADAAALGDLGQMPPPVEESTAILVRVPLTAEQASEENVGPIVDRVRGQVTGAPAGLTVWVTGGPAIGADFEAAFDSLDTVLLLVTAGVVALVLLVTYRSPLLLLVPLACVGAAIALSQALVAASAEYGGLVVDGASASILTVLLFGAGTDYALLLISRYREELRHEPDRHVAMRHALARSVPAIAASGATVILALLALLLADMNSTRGLGPVAAIGIGSALLAMVTLLPAVLVVCGRWVFWPAVPKARAEGAPGAEGGVRAGGVAASAGGWERVAAVVARRPRAWWVGTAVVLAALTAGVATLSTGLPLSASFVTTPDSVRGMAELGRHFPAGSGSPTEVYTRADRQAAVTAAVERVAGVAEVGGPEPSNNGALVRVPLVLDADADSARARATVGDVRAAVHAADPAALVGGAAAEGLDADTTMNRDLRVVLPVILAVVLLVLVVLLRAVVAPLLLLASVVLSFGAALGASALIFHLIGFPQVDNSLLLNSFLFLVALGVDYTIFLMTRAREETARLGHARGVPHALAVTGGVITSAGLVLAATFSVLAVLPLVFMMQLGIAVAVGVLLDTFVVRTLLVPALVLDVGPRSWWPSAPGGRAAVSADGPVPERVPAEQH
ncbi:MMPL family transporter [Virgisporangium ochraceum]|uniref:Putative membrane protein ActII-3 n=1 Tax=Virgisporangium ochraceum TaxID=65505 RepID=A0A8J4EKB9_9ACTN|nr:MMPL family transporter [Virgisporangium ochraceum]GIJ75222.1 putative membrane protein ActII-3 [Virgisporangium ochraceum]